MSPMRVPAQLIASSGKGHEIRLYGFAPITRPKARLDHCEVTFNAASPFKPIPNSDNTEPSMSLGPVGTVSVPVRQESNEVPEYFADLGLEISLQNIHSELDWNKARALEQAGRYAEAADIYFRFARDITPRFPSFFSLRKDAARCYAKAGNKAAVVRIEAELARAWRGQGNVGP